MDIGNSDAITQKGASFASGPNPSPYVAERGGQYHVPYRTVRKVVFSDLKKGELVDAQHAARLQYRLMLLDSVIKAAVDFEETRITIIYNPKAADNTKAKTSLAELVLALSKEGVRADPASTSDGDYDYYKEFYYPVHNPRTMNESPPYGHTMNEWEAIKPGWEKRTRDATARKWKKFKEWQDDYLEANPKAAQKIAEDHGSGDEGN